MTLSSATLILVDESEVKSSLPQIGAILPKMVNVFLFKNSTKMKENSKVFLSTGSQRVIVHLK
jgi:hypothetical protein